MADHYDKNMFQLICVFERMMAVLNELISCSCVCSYTLEQIWRLHCRQKTYFCNLRAELSFVPHIANEMKAGVE